MTKSLIKKNKALTKKLKILKTTEKSLLLKTAIAIEIFEKEDPKDFDYKFFSKNNIAHIQTMFYYNLSGHLSRNVQVHFYCFYQFIFKVNFLQKI